MDNSAKIRRFKETAMRAVFLLSALVSIIAVLCICIFLIAGGAPSIARIGVGNFLFTTVWRPGNELFGIFHMIVGSICVTAGAMVIGVPLGVLCAVFMARYCPKKLYRFLKPAAELMAGIPSIIYGFFGLMVIVPAIQALTGTGGKGLFTASLLLGIMILPTIEGVCESALRAVPDSLREGALALGAGEERAIFAVELPAAKSGVLAGIVLGIGRAIGETMAVVMVAGNAQMLPTGLFGSVRTLTANIVLELGYAQDLHRGALIGTGVVLFAFIMLINICLSTLGREKKHDL